MYKPAHYVGLIVIPVERTEERVFPWIRRKSRGVRASAGRCIKNPIAAILSVRIFIGPGSLTASVPGCFMKLPPVKNGKGEISRERVRFYFALCAS